MLSPRNIQARLMIPIRAGDMGKRTVYLDRDNTIIEDCPYCSSREQVRLMEGAGEAISMLNRSGAAVIVLTNQSGIGRGYFTVGQMVEVNDEMQRQLAEHDAHIDRIYYCPHKPEDGCSCRKPLTGLIAQARKDLGSSDEYVIGDRDDIDGEMARRAGLEYAIVGENGILQAVEEYLRRGSQPA